MDAGVSGTALDLDLPALAPTAPTVNSSANVSIDVEAHDRVPQFLQVDVAGPPTVRSPREP